MKRLVMECIGTFFLTAVAAFTGHPLAIGMVLMAMVYCGSHISGGHFNPAVSLAIYLRGLLSAQYLGLYALAQSIGATAAAFFFHYITANPFIATSHFAQLGLEKAFLIELIFTIVLCLTILVVATTQVVPHNSIFGIAIGAALLSIAFIGGTFNPAIALGSSIAEHIHTGMVDARTVIVYLAGPLAGGAISAALFKYFERP